MTAACYLVLVLPSVVWPHSSHLDAPPLLRQDLQDRIKH